MKKNTLCLLLALSLVSMSSLALAAAPAKQAETKTAYSLSPEKRAAIQDVVDSHKARLFDLHEKLWAKKTELKALVAEGKAERSDIQGLIGEMLELRAAKHQERETMRAEIEKIVGHRLHHRFWKRFHHGEHDYKDAEMFHKGFDKNAAK